jgi:phenylpropionate dioxygenase-like ring-hydroxylating dioxygenase large terminal subunit
MFAPEDLFDPKHYGTVYLPPEQASTLPQWCYTSQAFFEREVKLIFFKVWNYVGHVSRIPNSGDFFTIEIVGVPIIVMRGGDGEVRAFYNSCRHRGTRILTGDGNCRAMVCPYHNWTYSTSGTLTATPLIEEDEHFSRSDFPLRRAKLERWAGFLFVNFDPDSAGLSAYLGDLPAKCEAYGPETMVCARRKEYSVAANWKLYFENYNDSLHIPFVHGGTLARQNVSGRKRASHEEVQGQYITHFTAHAGSRGLLEGESGFPPIETLTDRYSGGTFYPCVYPTMLLGCTIDCLWVFELHPRGPDRTDLVATSFFPKDRLDRPDFEELAEGYYRRVDTVLPEDNQAVEQQQAGLRIPHAAAGKITHMETLCHAFDKWVLDRVLDAG